MSDTDRAGVERAARDYIEGYLEADAERHLRAYHPECVKRRYIQDESGLTRMAVLSPQIMADGASRADRITDCDVEIFIDDISEDIASVRVYSCKWVDFLHLAKARGSWRLLHVTWHPVTD